MRVEIPVIRARRENSPSVPIYSGQGGASGAPSERESLSRTVERSPFRAGFGFGLGFATATAVFRSVAVLLVYGFMIVVMLMLLRRVF